MSPISRRWRIAVCALVSLPTGGCFRTTAPPGWLPTPEEAQREAFGAWMRIEYRIDSVRRVIEGELIAAATDSIYVLGADSLVALPVTPALSGTLTTYDARLDMLGTWTLMGTLSTASHGIVLLLSAPIWIIAGTASTASASKDPRIGSTDPSLIRQFARFPQGMPPGVDRRSLRQRNVGKPRD
jgi:hypothetical protein